MPKEEKALELTDIPQASIGAPCTIVLSDELNLYVTYFLENTPEEFDGTQVRVMGMDSENEPLAIVKFNFFHAFQFGPPNDEAFSGHPLSHKGLEPHGAFQILGSNWLASFEKMNSVHPLHKKEHFDRFKHFILSFHDTTLEVIAESFEIETLTGSLPEAIVRISSELKC